MGDINGIDRRLTSRYTTGSWSTEDESAAAFDDAAGHDLWTVYPEVSGVLSQPRPSQPDKGLRIDRILVPRQKLIAAGWNHGCVGVEIKRSNVKIGPPIAQAMDYSRAVWTLPTAGIKVWLDWVFIWPMEPQHETTGSILAQNRIGSASEGFSSRLHLRSGSSNVIRVGRDGSINIGHAANGCKAGNR